MTTITTPPAPPVDPPTQAPPTPEVAPPHAPAEVDTVLGEYEDVSTVVAAAEKFRDAGYQHWDLYAPFPIHGIEKPMGIKYTKLPWVTLTCGLTGLMTGLALATYTMASEFPTPFLPFSQELWGYPYLISGKPYHSLPAWIPIMFELTIMFAAYSTVFGMFLFNKLPMLYNPLFKSERFKRATQDRFFIGVNCRDRKFDVDEITKLLKDTGSTYVETVTN
ncbi:MAG: DUF3341 domain-containing protein [Planctomycetota bacterium]